MSTPCKGCQEPILWAQTEDGKKMPLNPTPHAAGNILEIGRTGAMLAVRVLKNSELANPPAGRRYHTHFQTCDTPVRSAGVRRRPKSTSSRG